MSRSRRHSHTPLVLVGLLVLPACGPFGYIKKTAKDATQAVARAKAEGAEELAPYEYWGATAYLDQSKVMMGYSEYERSFDYAERSLQLAKEAKAKSDRREGSGDVVSKDGVATPEQEVGSTPAQDSQTDAAAGGAQ